jgi:hypothetical protein
MSDNGAEMPSDPDELSQETDELVPLFAPGTREDEEEDLLQEWTTAPEEEQINRLTGRPDWKAKATIVGLTLLGIAAVVFMVQVIGGGTSGQRSKDVNAPDRVAAIEKMERRQARQNAAIRERARARKERRRIARQKAIRQRRQAQREAEREPKAATSAPIQTASSEALTPAPQASPPPAGTPVTAPAPAPTPSPLPAPVVPAEASPGQAAEAFGPGP